MGPAHRSRFRSRAAVIVTLAALPILWTPNVVVARKVVGGPALNHRERRLGDNGRNRCSKLGGCYRPGDVLRQPPGNIGLDDPRMLFRQDRAPIERPTRCASRVSIRQRR
jgi:hypothetical protein